MFIKTSFHGACAYDNCSSIIQNPFNILYLASKYCTLSWLLSWVNLLYQLYFHFAFCYWWTSLLSGWICICFFYCWCLLLYSQVSEIQVSCLVVLCTGLGESRECKNSGDGFDYDGTLAETTTGKTCQRWDQQTPHSHTFTILSAFNKLTQLSDAQNYCRFDWRFLFSEFLINPWPLYC